MRFVAVLAAVLLPASLAWAHGMDDRVPDARELADLEAKAAVASPDQQPFLYAQLVHSMTEIATAQFQSGDTRLASESLKSAQTYAAKIQMSLLHDAHKLKNAEILIRHTAFRLHELLTQLETLGTAALNADPRSTHQPEQPARTTGTTTSR